jgi:hypothetical protein
VKFDPNGDVSYAGVSSAVTNANTHAQAQHDYQVHRGAQGYGYDANGNLITSGSDFNPYSEAMVLKKNYEDSVRGTNNSYAGAGSALRRLATQRAGDQRLRLRPLERPAAARSRRLLPLERPDAAGRPGPGALPDRGSARARLPELPRHAEGELVADYTNAQQVAINHWQQSERKFEAGARARARHAVKAPKAIGGNASAGLRLEAPLRRGTPAPASPQARSSGRRAVERACHRRRTVEASQALIAAATRLRYGPQEQVVNKQLAQNQRYTNGLGDWYANAVAQIQALRGQGQAQSAQNLQNVQAYGTQPVLSDPTDQQAALARNSLNSEYGAMFARDAGADDAALARIGAALGIQQGNTRNQANAERQQLLGGLASLKGQEGDFQTTYGSQLQAQADKTATANQRNEIAAKALGIKVGAQQGQDPAREVARGRSHRRPEGRAHERA